MMYIGNPFQIIWLLYHNACYHVRSNNVNLASDCIVQRNVLLVLIGWIYSLKQLLFYNNILFLIVILIRLKIIHQTTDP